MSIVSDGDRRYSDVCWLEAHNAFSSKANRWLYNQQSLSFDDLYDYGVRCFSIDIHWHKYGVACAGSGKREIAMMHGENGFLNTVAQRQGPPQRFEVFAQKLSEWLSDRDKSQDIITVTLESYIGDSNALGEIWDKYDLSDKIYIHPKRTQWNRRSRWPTLGELREDGTRLIIFSSNPRDGLNNSRTFISSNHWDYGANPKGDVLLRTRGALVKFNHIQPNSVDIGSRYKKFNSYRHIATRAEAFMESLSKVRDHVIPNFVNVDHVEVGFAKNLVEKFNNDFAEHLK